MKSRLQPVGVVRTALTFIWYFTAFRVFSWAINISGERSWWRVRDLDLKLEEGKGEPSRVLTASVSIRGVPANRHRAQRRRRTGDQVGRPAGSLLRQFRPEVLCASSRQVAKWTSTKADDERKLCQVLVGMMTATRKTAQQLPFTERSLVPDNLLNTLHALSPRFLKQPWGDVLGSPHFTKVTWFV